MYEIPLQIVRCCCIFHPSVCRERRALQQRICVQGIIIICKVIVKISILVHNLIRLRKMVLDLGNYEVLGVVMYNLTWALLAEVMCWFFIYSSPKFKNLKIQIEKHLAKVDDGKDSSSKSNKKREARLQPWREEASKQFMSIQFKTGIIVSRQSTISPNYVFIALTTHPASTLAPRTHRQW